MILTLLSYFVLPLVVVIVVVSVSEVFTFYEKCLLLSHERFSRSKHYTVLHSTTQKMNYNGLLFNYQLLKTFLNNYYKRIPLHTVQSLCCLVLKVPVVYRALKSGVSPFSRMRRWCFFLYCIMNVRKVSQYWLGSSCLETCDWILRTFPCHKIPSDSWGHDAFYFIRGSQEKKKNLNMSCTLTPWQKYYKVL